MVGEDKRPDPEALLKKAAEEEYRSQRGKLRIFFGACAGVGKTYAMLSTAKERLREGLDVVIGIIETHGRHDTAKLAHDFPTIPQKELEHRGVKIREFDLDAALQRKPALILMDELAHSNAPGCRHPKRWNDVEELLEAGIDVYTTLNVQHLESLNDIVASITGVMVNETIPDSFFDKADDITLVDIPSDELLKRLREGKVYLADQAKDRAAQNFFKKNNLIALRELALRRTTERVDAQMEDYQQREGIQSSQQAVSGKLLVCIGPEPLSAKLVRTSRSLAASFKTSWKAIYVQNDRHHRLNEAGLASLQRVKRIVERMGGEIEVIEGNDAAEEILAYAAAHGYSKIVVGRNIRSKWRQILFGSLSEKIIRKSGNYINVYVITEDEEVDKEPMYKAGFIHSPLKNYLYSLLLLAVITIGALPFDKILEPVDTIMFYLIGALTAAIRFGRGPSVVYTLFSLFCFNFFFVEPRFELHLDDKSYFLTFLVMLFTSLVITHQAYQLRWQALFARKREKEIRSLYGITKQLASTRGQSNITRVAATNIAEIFEADTCVWRPDSDGVLSLSYGEIKEDMVREENAARWAYEHKQPAGFGTSTMPSAKYYYLPLVTPSSHLGVVGIWPKAPEQFDQEKINILETFVSLFAVALERTQSADQAEQAKVEAESEKLRNILLSMVSYDLRTPLSSIISSASILMQQGEKVQAKKRHKIATTIFLEATRLSRLVGNLLDIVKLESGKIELNTQPYYIEELIGSAMLQSETALAEHIVHTYVEPHLPIIEVDGLLIEQVLVNLLDNASKYTPKGSKIEIHARADGKEIKVEIKDNGPGIPEGNEEKIFQKFFVPENTKGGTGLGLAICEGIIKAHKGSIRARNQPEGGSVFEFSLPASDILVPQNFMKGALR